MPIELLPSLLLSLIAVGYTPGPANIYSLSCVLTYGRKRPCMHGRDCSADSL